MEISNTDISTFLNMVDTFYNNAWNRLVLYGALLILIVGIVLPIILQFISQRVQQSKNIEMENKLREEFTNLVTLKGKSIEEKNRNVIDNYFEENEKIIENKLTQLNRDISFSKALSYHNLGVKKCQEKKILEGIKYYLMAGQQYIIADNESGLKIILGNLESNCLTIDKTKDSFEFKKVKKNLDIFINNIKTKFPDDKYFEEITKIEKAIFIFSETKK